MPYCLSIVASAAIKAAAVVLVPPSKVKKTVSKAASLCQNPALAQHSATGSAEADSDRFFAHADALAYFVSFLGRDDLEICSRIVLFAVGHWSQKVDRPVRPLSRLCIAIDSIVYPSLRSSFLVSQGR